MKYNKKLFKIDCSSTILKNLDLDHTQKLVINNEFYGEKQEYIIFLSPDEAVLILDMLKKRRKKEIKKIKRRLKSVVDLEEEDEI